MDNIKWYNKVIIGLLSISVIGTGVSLYKVFTIDQSKEVVTTYKDIEITNDGNYIKWKNKESNNWSNIVSVSALNGANGKEVEIEKTGNKVMWRYKGETDWNILVDLTSLAGKAGESGEDGRKIELTTDETHIKYRYDGDNKWINLIELSNLKGDNGNDGTDGSNGTNGLNGTNGKEVELFNDGLIIKWKYKGETTWKNLASVASLKGPSGDEWIQLGIIDVSDYCNPDPNATGDCGYGWYIKEELLDEGKYIFQEDGNGDEFIFHVETERSDNQVLIEYWSTEERIPYYIQGVYDGSKWDFQEFNFVQQSLFKTLTDSIDRTKLNTIEYSDDIRTKIESHFNTIAGFNSYQAVYIFKQTDTTKPIYIAKAYRIGMKAYFEYYCIDSPGDVYYNTATYNNNGNLISFATWQSKVRTT